MRSQCLYTETGLENPNLKQIWILPSRSGLCPLLNIIKNVETMDTVETVETVKIVETVETEETV